MPRPTWDNLAEPRRERVLAAAMAEFAARGFSGGSLNVIAREADVAKGSLFQYFDDKLDLFAYVCDVTSRRIRDEVVVQSLTLDPDLPVFDYLAGVLRVWVDYFRDHPVERGVTAATNLEMDGEVRAAVREVAGRHYLEFVMPLLVAAQEHGDLRPDADLDALAASLLLLAPHLALAPYLPGLDPVLGLYGADPDTLDRTIDRLVAPLRAAYASMEDA
ncbi:MAG: TetR/AcrR family transcriptional regulator [Candidatus Nanopelagicales bacterium]